MELDKTNDDIEKLVADIHVTDSCIGNRYADIDGLNGNINKRMIDIDDKNKDIGINNAEIHRLNDNLGKAKHDQARLKDKLNEEVDVHHKLRLDQDHQNVLRGNVRDLEAQNGAREAQINVLRDEIDQLKHAFHSSEECNRNLEEELAILNKHSDMMIHQNHALNKELEEQVANEEYVRRELDRRGKVASIQKDNDDHLRQSLHMLNEVKARSPVRRGR